MFVAAVLGPLVAAAGDDDRLVLLADAVHLGDGATPEWPEAPEEPTAAPLRLAFQAKANAGEWTLTLSQRHVQDRWALALNGREIATLDRFDDVALCHYAVPAGALVDGDNVLTLSCSTTTDDITVAAITLDPRPLREVLALVPLRVHVTDDEGADLPARITIVAADDTLPRLFDVAPAGSPVRDGVVYTAGGPVSLLVPRGPYTVHASRGFEWSHGEQQVALDDEGASVELSLSREVDTTGWVAADTHLHTLEISGHGDASLAERVVTLAGEGVELAVATDHNHNVDYRPHQAAAGLAGWYTPVVGNEVTTPIGHFNAFPLDPRDEVPLHTSEDWIATVDGMRARGAGVVILNHPRWPAPTTGPFGVEGLDALTGARASGAPFPFDAIELVNSTLAEPDMDALLQQWFALLDRGERHFVVGSSDTHTVGDPAGQGRTYVASSTDDPAALDVDELAGRIARGDCSVSYGLFVDVRADGRSVMGRSLSVRDGALDVQVVVRAPSWARPLRVRLFANGALWHEADVDATPGRPTDVTLELPLRPTHDHDVHLVAVVVGEAAGGRWWPSFNDYTLAVANPVFVDVDGDGLWTSPRDRARALLADGPDPAHLASADQAVCVQYLDLARELFEREARQRLGQLGADAASRHPGVAALLGEAAGASAEGK